MSIIRRVPWTRQPQTPVSVAWTNPLVIQAGIFAVVDGATGRILRRSGAEQMLRVSGGIVGATSDGKAFTGSGGTDDGWVSSSNFDDISGLTEFSFYALGNAQSAAGNIAGRWGSTANFGGYLTTFNSGEIFTVYATDNLSGNWNARLTSGFTAGRFSYGSSYGGGTSLGYLNGRPSSGTLLFTGSPTVIQTVAEKLYIGRNADTASSTPGISVNLIVYGSKKWDDSIQRRLDADPWQLFTPQARTLWIPESGPAFRQAQPRVISQAVQRSVR